MQTIGIFNGKYDIVYVFYYNACMHVLMISMLLYYMHAVLEYLSGSPFGSNYQLPLVGVYCNSGASNISECQLYNQTNPCNHQRTVGVFCKGNLGKVLYSMPYYRLITLCSTCVVYNYVTVKQYASK